ncbi:metal-sulfur cluster assembly factor [Omnitrophica bacterium]|nr:metal-sulfur cluster assembly factor [Candidatus Omnitrophota bacterium]
MPTREDVIEVAKKCFDPEIPVNIWDLGLIYEIETSEDSPQIKIRMTLTNQHCPMAKMIADNLRNQIQRQLEVEDIQIDLVFDPPWTPDCISNEGKKKLGIQDA